MIISEEFSAIISEPLIEGGEYPDEIEFVRKNRSGHLLLQRKKIFSFLNKKGGCPLLSE